MRTDEEEEVLDVEVVVVEELLLDELELDVVLELVVVEVEVVDEVDVEVEEVVVVVVDVDVELLLDELVVDDVDVLCNAPQKNNIRVGERVGCRQRQARGHVSRLRKRRPARGRRRQVRAAFAISQEAGGGWRGSGQAGLSGWVGGNPLQSSQAGPPGHARARVEALGRAGTARTEEEVLLVLVDVVVIVVVVVVDVVVVVVVVDVGSTHLSLIVYTPRVTAAATATAPSRQTPSGPTSLLFEGT